MHVCYSVCVCVCVCVCVPPGVADAALLLIPQLRCQHYKSCGWSAVHANSDADSESLSGSAGVRREEG